MESFHPRELLPEHRERLDQLVASGQPWKARDYCMSLIGNYRYNEDLYRTAGRILKDMGEEATAGLYWLLTSEMSDEAEHAIDVAIGTFGKRLHLHVRLYIPPENLPEAIRARLQSCLTSAGAKPSDHIPHIRGEPPPGGCRDAVILWGCGVVLFVILVLLTGGFMHWYGLLFGR